MSDNLELTPGKSNGDYSANSIQVLEGLEAVRKRPAMYIGDVGVKGLHHLVYGVIHHFINQAMQTFNPYIANVHGRTLSYSLQSLQYSGTGGTEGCKKASGQVHWRCRG